MKATEVRIRLATKADAAAISELVSSLSREFITHELTDQGAAALLSSMSERAIGSYFEKGYRFHVAETGGITAGAAAMAAQQEAGLGEQAAAPAGSPMVGVVAVRDNSHLYYLFVAKSHQRCGLGRRLWETAQSACLDAGHSGEFTVNASSFSIPVYKRFGFVEESGPVAHNGVVSTPMRRVAQTPPRLGRETTGGSSL